MRISLYRLLLRSFLVLRGIGRSWFGYRSFIFIHRVGIAIRYIFFPDFSKDLSQTTPARIGMDSGTNYGPMPDWLVKDIITTGNEFDPDLYAASNSVESFVPTSFIDDSNPGSLLRQIFDSCSRDYYDAIFIVPAYFGGGAEKQARTLAHTIASKDASVLFVTTVADRESSVFATDISLQHPNHKDSIIRLNESPHVCEFHHVSYIVAYFLSSFKPKLIYTCNSNIGYRILIDYGKQLSSQSAIATGAWCYDYDPNHNEVGYVRKYLPKIYPLVSFIISDNTVFPSQLVSKHGYDMSKFCVVPTPVTTPSRPWSAPAYSDAPRVLWAGRWCRQKRVDLLLQIATTLPNIQFDVYGYATDAFGAGFEVDARNINNLHLKGKFTDFSELDVESASAFLYTSAWDGMPNILLEAAATGLPIVASLVGGIGDSFDDNNAVLLREDASVNDYAEALRLLVNDTRRASIVAYNGQSTVLNKHTKGSYEESISPILGLFKQ